jgi:hypothetical protein
MSSSAKTSGNRRARRAAAAAIIALATATLLHRLRWLCLSATSEPRQEQIAVQQKQVAVEQRDGPLQPGTAQLGQWPARGGRR